MKLLLCVVKARISQNFHPVDSTDTTTTHIILERNNQEKFPVFIETVRTLFYGSFSYIFS